MDEQQMLLETRRAFICTCMDGPAGTPWTTRGFDMSTFLIPPTAKNGAQGLCTDATIVDIGIIASTGGGK